MILLGIAVGDEAGVRELPRAPLAGDPTRREAKGMDVVVARGTLPKPQGIGSFSIGTHGRSSPTATRSNAARSDG